MKSKARSPTQRKSTKNTEGQRSAIDVVLLALQCSQRIGQWIVLLSAVHVLFTCIACLCVEAATGDLLRQILADCCDKYYRWAVTFYFGKAAAENVLKITKDMKSSNAYMSSVQSADDDSNG